MSVQTFDNDDDMFRYLEELDRQAEARLQDEQRALTFGDHWVRFVNVVTREIEFGRVHTIEEIEPEAIEQTRRLLEQEHKMFGRAHIFWQPQGELGYTHKVSAWPIPQEVFADAESNRFRIDHLTQPHKEILEQAWTSIRSAR